ncbi:MAG: hypothetical protein ACYSW7_05330 [Planctomycetota bacterium]
MSCKGGKHEEASCEAFHKDERVKRLTANDIIGHFLKRRELVDLEERIEKIEERLEARG